MWRNTDHGGAQWATDKVLRKAGMLDSVGRGVYLGKTAKSGLPICEGGEACVFTLGPRGSGKTAGAVIPTLLTYRGSVVVTDPKGALTAITARRRRELGNRVVVLNPWREEMTRELGVDLGDTAFNPLGHLTLENPSLLDDVDAAAAMLCPTPHDAKDPSWTDAGRSILSTCLTYLAVSPDHEATLPALYQLVRREVEEWEDLTLAMVELDADLFSSASREILEPLKAPRQWAGIKQAINNATAIYAPSRPLGAHVSGHEFDPRDLKREAVTVFIVVPALRREANKNWLALVMQMCAAAVGRPGPARPVLLLAEEFQNLGAMPTIGKAMAEYREAGLRAWLIVQNIPELRKLYGPDGAEALIANCEIHQYLSVSDQRVAEHLEKVIGTHTIASGSSSTQRNEFFDKGSDTRSHMGQPLIRAQDIRNLPRSAQILLAPGEVPPILAQLDPYYANRDLAPHADANPYRAGQPETSRPRASMRSPLSGVVGWFKLQPRWKQAALILVAVLLVNELRPGFSPSESAQLPPPVRTQEDVANLPDCPEGDTLGATLRLCK